MADPSFIMILSNFTDYTADDVDIYKSSFENGHANWTHNNNSMLPAFIHRPRYTVDDMAVGHTWQVALITLYSVSTFLAIGGNVTVIYVLVRANKLRLDLTVFLINLAVADLCIALFCMPFTFTRAMLNRWIFGDVMCPLVLFMQHLSVCVSVFTNMAIGLDRYWAVLYPMKSRLTTRRSKGVIGLVWLLAVLVAGVQLVVSRNLTAHLATIKYEACMERWPSEIWGRTYTLLMLISTYILPVCILAFTYVRIGVTLWERTPPGNADHSRDTMHLLSKRKVIKMLIAIVIAFALCWFPLHVFGIIKIFFPHLLSPNSQLHDQIILGAFFSCHWIAMAHSFVNVVIYGFLNETFMEDLCFLLPCYSPAIFRLRSRRPSTSSRSSVSRGGFGFGRKYGKNGFGLRSSSVMTHSSDCSERSPGETLPLKDTACMVMEDGHLSPVGPDVVKARHGSTHSHDFDRQNSHGSAFKWPELSTAVNDIGLTRYKS